MYSWNMNKYIYFIYFLKKDFYHFFSHDIGVFVLVYPLVILLLFHNSDGVNGRFSSQTLYLTGNTRDE